MATQQIILEFITKGTRRVNAALANVDKRMSSIEKRANRISSGIRRAQAALLSFGLAALFAGMAVRNFAVKTFQRLITTFKEATEGSVLYANTLGKLAAAFEFLKFTIVDAFLASEFGTFLIQTILDIVDSISALIDNNPALANLAVIFLAIAAVLGTFLMILGQVGLAMIPIVGSLVIFKVFPGILTTIGNAFSLIKAKLLLVGLGIVALVGFVKGLIEGFTGFFTANAKVNENITYLGNFLKGVLLGTLNILFIILKMIFAAFKQIGIVVGTLAATILAFVGGALKSLIDSLKVALDFLKKVAKAMSKNNSRSKATRSRRSRRMATGGIVSSPTTATIGEAGPEAVVPLDRMGSMGNTTINVNVGGSNASPNDIAEAVQFAIQRTLTRKGLGSGV